MYKTPKIQTEVKKTIPKIIHYCWFGKRDKPESVLKCIESWKYFFPGYEIWEWNEETFNHELTRYTRDAYKAKKYAFVSDYVRIHVLFEYGGIYFDTDVEVVRPMHDLIEKGNFMGCEIDGGIPGKEITVNPGLVLAAEDHLVVYSEILEIYERINFCDINGVINKYAIVEITTDVLKQCGLKNIPGIQEVAGITIYPSDYFNPMDSLTGKITRTENTRSIHWYSFTWGTPFQRFKNKIGKFIRRLI